MRFCALLLLPALYFVPSASAQRAPGLPELDQLWTNYEAGLSRGETHEYAARAAVEQLQGEFYLSGTVEAQGRRRDQAIATFRAELSGEFFKKPGTVSLDRAMNSPPWRNLTPDQQRLRIMAAINGATSRDQLIWGTRRYLDHLESTRREDVKVDLDNLADQTRAARKKFGVATRFDLVGAAVESAHPKRTQYVLGYFLKSGTDYMDYTRPLLEAIAADPTQPTEATNRARSIVKGFETQIAAQRQAAEQLRRPPARNPVAAKATFVENYERGLAELARDHPDWSADRVIARYQQDHLNQGALAALPGQLAQEGQWQGEVESAFKRTYRPTAPVATASSGTYDSDPVDPSGCAVVMAKRASGLVAGLKRLIGR